MELVFNDDDTTFSLGPKHSSPPVFDPLQYANMEGEDLGELDHVCDVW